MNAIKLGFALGAAMLASVGAYAGPKEDAQAVVGKFLTVISDGKSVDDMVALFSPDALMFGTTMSDAGTGPAAVRQYFGNNFATRLGPTKYTVLTTETLVISDDVVVLAGRWQSERLVSAAPSVITSLRYLFVENKRGGQWYISALHSSPAPAATPAPAPAAAPAR